MNSADGALITRSKQLRYFSHNGLAPSQSVSTQQGSGLLAAARHHALDVPVAIDIDGRHRAIERIREGPFVEDAGRPQFAAAQHWIEVCNREVQLPPNFCGGLLITRLYRLITPSSEQTATWMSAVYEAAAAYDFAFLALAHADDEADLTTARDGKPSRFITHPDTRAVDGINLLLSGVTAMQDALARWPHRGFDPTGDVAGRHPLALEIMYALTRALREASFPILMDRAGLGHEPGTGSMMSGLAPILIDGESLHRVEAFTRHRAHTYLMRAAELATLLAGYADIEPDLAGAMDDLFGLWGLLGAATDDLQDLFIDFAVGIHSVCTVMAHLCVAEEIAVRPAFRRQVPDEVVRDQRGRLALLFGATESGLDRSLLVELLDEIDLRRALLEHFEPYGTRFARAIYKAASQFGFSAKLMIEMVSVVCGDPDFGVPDIYLAALETVSNEEILALMEVQVGKLVTAYFVERYWPGSVEC